MACRFDRASHRLRRVVEWSALSRIGVSIPGVVRRSARAAARTARPVLGFRSLATVGAAWGRARAAVAVLERAFGRRTRAGIASRPSATGSADVPRRNPYVRIFGKTVRVARGAQP